MSRFDQEEGHLRRSIIRKTSIFAMLFSCVVFVLGLNGREPLGTVQSTSEDVGARIMTVMSMPGRGLENLISAVGQHFDVAEENKALRAEIERLREIENEDVILREQVKYLEAALNTQIEDIGSADQVAARAVSENDGPFAKSALVNVGQTQGVEKGNAVMTVNGLFGRVVRSGRSSARVLMLNDLNSRIPVMSLRSGSRAIMSGTNGTRPVLEFRGDGDWQIGDKVVTSGDDGGLPRGLSIGNVVGVKANTLGVELGVDAKPVDWVRIIPFKPVSQPENDPALISEIDLVITEIDPVLNDDALAQVPSGGDIDAAVEDTVQ